MAEISIAADETESSSVKLIAPWGVVVAIETPAELTAAEFTIQAKGSDGTWKPIQKDDADYIVAAAADLFIPLRPDLMAGAREVRIVADSAEEEARTLWLHTRDIN